MERLRVLPIVVPTEPYINRHGIVVRVRRELERRELERRVDLSPWRWPKRTMLLRRSLLRHSWRRVKRIARSTAVAAAWFGLFATAALAAPAQASDDNSVTVAPFGMLISVLRPILRGGTSGGGGGGAQTYDYLTPAYTLPTGMTYNAATGLVEGTTIDTTYATTLPTNEVPLTDQGTRAANKTALNNAITTAAASGSGTRIMCPSGVDYGGNYNLPVNNSTGWIYIETQEIKDGTFIAEGTRATSAHVGDMPKLYSTAVGLTGVVFHLPGGNNKYRFAGLHIAFAPSGVTWNADTSSTANQVNGFITVVDTGGSAYSGTNVALYPNDVTIDRCFISGIDGKNLKRAVWLNGTRMAVIDSTIDEVRNAAASGASDGQGITCTTGPGPYKFHNLNIRAAARGENIMIGGGNTGINPADGQVTNCHMDFPVAWHATLETKNLGEHKCGIRWLWQGNVFSNYKTNAVGSQYFAINFKTSDDTGAFPLTETRDITFRLNVLRNCSGGFLMATDPNNNAVNANRMELTCNRLEVPTSDYSAVQRSWGLQVSSNMAAFTLKHNSLYCTPKNDGFAIVATDESAGNMGTHVYQDNLFGMGTGLATNSWFRSGNGLWTDGNTTWNNLQGSGTFTGNSVTKSATLPSNNTPVASLVAADCDSAAGGTLELNGTSPLLGTATSGRDPGAVHALIETAITGVV